MKSKYIVAFIIMQFIFLTIVVGFVFYVNDIGAPSDAHLPFYYDITDIKNRLTVNITEPGFTNPVTVCEFYELREVYSDEF